MRARRPTYIRRVRISQSTSGWVDIPKLLDDLRERGVKLRVQQGKVAIEAPAGTIRPSEIESLRKRKDDVVKLICDHDGQPVMRDTAHGMRPFCPWCEKPLFGTKVQKG